MDEPLCAHRARRRHASWLVAESARRYGDRVALVDGPTGQEVTYAQLAERVERVSALLAERGFGPGAVLALRARRTSRPGQAWRWRRWPPAGRSPALLTSTPAEVARQVEDSGASLLVTARGFDLRGSTRSRSATDCSRRGRRRARPRTRAASRCCRIRAARPGCRRASRSRTATSSPACVRPSRPAAYRGRRRARARPVRARDGIRGHARQRAGGRRAR